MLKRATDLIVSATGLVLLIPVFLAIAAAIAVDSGMPIFFSQTRVGLLGSCFRIWKFRSMRAGAGRLITASGDRRITRVGRFLRAHKLDELPQLWNVVRGEMSLVGPRPELPEFVAAYPDLYEKLLAVRPGLTDPASLAYGNEERMLRGVGNPEGYYAEFILPAKLEISQRYLMRRTFISDARILLNTVRLSLKS